MCSVRDSRKLSKLSKKQKREIRAIKRKRRAEFIRSVACPDELISIIDLPISISYIPVHWEKGDNRETI